MVLMWQGLFIALLVGAGVIPTVVDGKNLQNFMICCQMLPASIAMLFAFPYQEYKGSGTNPGQRGRIFFVGWVGYSSSTQIDTYENGRLLSV
jgi:hypothetical protein